MYVVLASEGRKESFILWGYGDQNLAVGGGIFVGEQGLVANHHFLNSPLNAPYQFKNGACRLEVFAKLIDRTKSLLLFSTDLFINEEQCAALSHPRNSIIFVLNPGDRTYSSYVDTKPVPVDAVQKFSDRVRSMFP